MKFEDTLLKVKLLKRYKRFFIDVKANNQILTAHCPNTGSMLGLLDKNNDAYISKSDNPNRKLKYTLEIIKVKDSLVGVNTHRANKIVLEALKMNLIKELKDCNEITPEVVFEKGTRFDFLLNKNNKNIFLEVKNVTLSNEKKIAEFPDAVTERGNKHLLKLMEAKKKGYDSYILYLIQRENIEKFKIANYIDPNYYTSFLKVKQNGVKILAYDCSLNSKEVKVNKPIKIL